MRFALALALTFGSPADRPGDRWLGRDKFLHFAAAAAIQSVAYAALRRDDTSRERALWGATALTAAVSIGKEVVDHRRGGAFSGRDLVWDAGGAGAATVAIIRWSRK
jgi:putative lipoprotein